MTLFNIKYIKTIAAVGAMVFFVGCTNDTVTTTGGIVDNESFKRTTLTIPVDLKTNAIELSSVRTNSLSNYILGSYKDANFGELKSDFAGQVTIQDFPGSIVGGATVESVELQLPLNLALKDVSVYEIQNFLGDYSSELSLNVSAFDNFLELYNVDGTVREYYADGTNNGNTAKDLGTETLLGSLANIAVAEEYTEATSLINVPLDVDFFQKNVLDKIVGEKNTSENLYYVNGESFSDIDFVEIFKGLKIEATNTGDGFIAPFNMSEANVELVYNNNLGNANDTLNLNFDRVNKNLYSRNHENANVANELYIQGAGGFEVSVDLESFITDYTTKAADEDWIINQAVLTIYTKEVVEDTLDDLYVYGIDENGDSVRISDYGFFTVSNPVGGIVKDANGENTQGYVQFFLTNYLRNALLADSNIKELRIKSRELNESTVLNTSSIDPKGIVLLNDLSSADKAPKLEVIYSAIKSE